MYFWGFIGILEILLGILWNFKDIKSYLLDILVNNINL